jgi:hypothetical protein
MSSIPLRIDSFSTRVNEFVCKHCRETFVSTARIARVCHKSECRALESKLVAARGYAKRKAKAAKAASA